MSHHTLLHRIVRPIVRRLAPTRIRPDHLTALRFATALLAAGAFAQGDRIWLDIGAGIFVLSALLDRADGELARQTNQFSTHGHRYDLLADWSASVMAFIGIGVGARNGYLGWGAPLLGVLAAIGVSVLFWSLNARALTPALLRPIVRGRRVLFDPDDAMFSVPVLLWSFGAAPVLLAAGTVTPLLALLMIVSLWRA